MAPIPLLSTVFPPSPTFKDTDLPSLLGKVYIVTGAASGVGFELAKILYLAGGSVYIAARSSSRCSDAIARIKSDRVRTRKELGKLESMVVDLADLATVKPAIESFLRNETRLDVLVHNAAVMTPPVGSKDKSGHDLEMGTNCLGPYLLTTLLEPIIAKTATMEGVSKGSVRLVWVTSLLQRGAPPGGMKFDATGEPVYIEKPFMGNYMQSKVGDAWLADRFAKRLGDKGVLSMSLHPGLMLTELQRHWPASRRVVMGLFLKGPVYGAYSELWTAFSPDVRMEHNGGHAMAWGRHADLPVDIVKGLKGKTQGGTGAAQTFFDYCDRETKAFM